MSIVLVGSTSGSVTLQEPAVSGSTVLTLPAVTGTVLTDTSPKAGNVIQVVNANLLTQASTTSGSFVDSGLSASITPTSSSSKILVTVHMTGLTVTVSSQTGLGLNIVRDSTQIFLFEVEAVYAGSFSSQLTVGGSGASYLDSPTTTSSTTYKVQAKRGTGSGTVFWASGNCGCSITLMEIAA